MTSPTGADDHTAAPRQWIVHTSRARTLLARRVGDGELALVKLFESGSLAEAQRELAFGELLAGCGVVRHREALVDAETGKVAVVMDFHDGIDLEEWIRSRGPLRARVAARHALELARILSGFAEHESPTAPRGVVHRDVKPSNILLAGDVREPHAATVMLLDLEHTVAASAESTTPTGEFSGGTHGFAPPEAYLGEQPTAAFDVFGFGCTLYAMLTGVVPFDADDELRCEAAVRAGRWRRSRLRGLPGPLRALVTACLQVVPARRPSWPAVIELLEPLAEPAPTETDLRREQILHEVRAGELDRAAAHLQEQDAVLEEMMRHHRRLLAHLEVPGDVDDEHAAPDVLARRIAEQAPRAQRLLRRFPAHAGGLAARDSVLAATARLLDTVLPTVAEHKRAARFADAHSLIDATQRALHAAERLGRRFAADRLARPTPLHRDPYRVLELAHRDLSDSERRHDEVLERLRAAEAELDLPRAASVLEEIAGVYGGASEVVADLKDDRLRLEFYLARIAQQRPHLRDLRELCDSASIRVDLSPLVGFLDLCTRSPEVQEYSLSQSLADSENLRTLRRGLRDLVRDYPHLRARVDTALQTLERTLIVVTDRAWELLADAEHKLSTPPIPIRPLQSLLSRLDNMRLLDVLVDRPGRSRGQLLDEIENLRTRLQQARATRDRLARGAQEAMDRGHLTTALYDMARAVNQFGAESDPMDSHREGPGLAAQFEEAKRRKRDIEDKLGENQRLAARYAEMCEDADYSPRERIAVLQAREDVLGFLGTNLGRERGLPFAEDLQIVQLELLRERSLEGRRMADEATSAKLRLLVVQQTYETLQLTMPEHGWDEVHVPEVRRILAQWRERLAEASEQVPAGEPAAARERRGIWGRLRGLFGK